MGSRSQNSSVSFYHNLALLHTLYTSLRLIISKILRVKSSLSSLSPLRYGDIVALFYKKLDIGSRLVLIQDAF